MKLSIQVASTSQTVNVFVRDSSSTTGAGLTGLVFNTASLTAYYALPKAAAVSITLATLAAITTAWSSGGFKEVDATNMPGWYRLDIPDAALASGRFVAIHLKGATNMAPLPLEIELTAWNNQDATRGGMTAMPNANAAAIGGLPTLGGAIPNNLAGASGGLPTLGAAIPLTSAGLVGGLPLAFDTSGSVNVIKVNGTSQTAADLGANTAAIKVQTDKLTFTVANQIDANVLDWKSSAAPAMTGDAFARIGAPAGASVSADIAAVKVDTGGAISELSQAQPPTTPTPQQAVMALYMALRNNLTTTASTKSVTNNAGTVIFKKALSDDGTTYTEAKAVSGP